MLWEAAERGEPAIVRLMLEHGAPVDLAHGIAKGWPPLRRTVIRGCAEFFAMILDAGGDVRTTDDSGATLLHDAVTNDDPLAFIELLVGLGLDINASDHGGKTPLVHALLMPDEAVLRTLLGHGADPTARDLRGYSALDYAKGGVPFNFGNGMLQTMSASPDAVIRLLGDAVGAWCDR